VSRQLPNGTKLAAFYQTDLTEQDLISECKHFKHHICWRFSKTISGAICYNQDSLLWL